MPVKHGSHAARVGLEALIGAGFHRCECFLTSTLVQEMNLEAGELSLLRTVADRSLLLSGIRDDRKASLSVNRTDPACIGDAASRLREMAASAEPDPAHDISPRQPQGRWEKGPGEADLELMHQRMAGLLDHARRSHPSLILRRAGLSFEERREHYVSSRGTGLRSRTGHYTLKMLFASKEAGMTSSFNYLQVNSASLARPLEECGNIDPLMRMSGEQVRAEPLRGKFRGDLIVTPECMGEFVGMVCMYLGDRAIVSGTSIFVDALGRRIADGRLTLRSLPLSVTMVPGRFITGDGFAAGDETLIEEGFLRSHLLTLYGSRKTGLKRNRSGGGFYRVEPGTTPLEEMVSSVDRGLLLGRFSGGRPSASGDFSGVAKNSYLIEGGRISRPVREVMISGELRETLLNITAVSSQTVDMGYCSYPWVMFRGITIFGK